VLVASPSIVITGAGLASPLGALEATWRALLEGRCAVRTATRLRLAGRPCATTAECAPQDPAQWLPTPKHAKFVGRSTALLLQAGQQAILTAGLRGAPYAPDRIGVSVASGHTGLDAEEFFPALSAAWEDDETLDYARLGGRASRLVDPYFSLRTLSNAGAPYLGSLAGATGPSTNLVQGETTGALALLEASYELREGRADAVLVGAHDSLVNVSSYLAHEREGLLARGGARARPRPFDAGRDGTVLGEAAAVVLLEREEEALARGVAPAGRLIGVGVESAPADTSLDAWRSDVVARAAGAAGSAAVDLVLAQALGTGAGDETLAGAVAATVGSRVPVTALAGAIGHVGAATGLVQAALALACLRDRVAPGVVGLARPDPACGIHALRGAAALGGSGALSVLCLTRSWPGQTAAVLIGAAADVDFRAGERRRRP
jgi:3-oxoacyl-[acyl-carrier-protein] synthase II